MIEGTEIRLILMKVLLLKFNTTHTYSYLSLSSNLSDRISHITSIIDLGVSGDDNMDHFDEGSAATLTLHWHIIFSDVKEEGEPAVEPFKPAQVFY